MLPDNHTELLKLLWRTDPPGELPLTGGGSVTVDRAGEYDNLSGRYRNAGIVHDGAAYRGDIIFLPEAGSHGDYENCILQVVTTPGPVILRLDGSPVAQAIMKPDPLASAAYESLKTGAGEYGCAGHISAMENHERIAMFTRLLTDRLHRKCGDLRRIYMECEQNWNETMYAMLMRTMGDSRNKEAFTELAHRVKYSALSRERNSIVNVEALLLGTSGLLEIYGDDSYIRELKAAYIYLQRKYNLMPMLAGQWSISHNNPHNHPALRIAQLAAFLSSREFLFDNLMKCATVDDLHTFFRAEASQYWSTHFVPGSRSGERPKRIGHFKANILGINLAVPMMFSYGDYTGEEELKARALELLEKINCEENRYINAWREGGVQMESAFDSQAMLQLNNEYCLHALCWQCPVGRQVVRKVVVYNP